MGKLVGKIVITNLPPRRGVIVSVAFFRVPRADAPAPFNGDPAGDLVTDKVELLNDVHLEREKADSSLEEDFELDRPDGFYYLQVRAILFRTQGESGRTFAQAEQFFFGRRSLAIPCERVTLPVEWPQIPLESLHHYGTVRPAR